MAIIMEHYANLHLHSTHSDGRYSPEELARIAKDLGFGALALTDHDTVSGNALLKKECDKLGIECIFGSEICGRLPETGHLLHLTAFHFDPEHPPIRQHIKNMAERYGGMTEELFERGVAAGDIQGITWDEVREYNAGIDWLCYSHVFMAMRAKGLITDAERFILKDKCFSDVHQRSTVKRHGFPEARDIITRLREAGAIVFVAHPHERLEDVKILIGQGLIDGIEVWHGELPAWERREALRLAMENDLYVSGGEDHSGLLGGQYYRFEKPEETKYFFPPRTLGTTKYFFEEIRDKKKKSDRKQIMQELIDNDELWQRTGGINDDATR